MSQPDSTFQPRRSTRHAHYTPVEARRILADAGASGLTLYAYARHHSLDAGLLYWWRGKLATGPSRRKHRASPGAAMPLTFIPMMAAEPDRPPVTLLAAPASGVELVVGTVTVRLQRDFCADTLRRAMAVVASGAPC